ncbi:ATP-binding cassette sub-family G member 1-like [Battus philenor]|uniref:ATP-binding cassette sub-family G member 1-like n=1 Tax=Battus philenor TaxID=42288 RepID=UPI0035D014A2
MIVDNQSVSQETNSTSSSEDSLNISFDDIVYKVRRGIFSGGRKTVLNNVSGTFNAGELTVIIGQSGAGKSSLMDILAGYTTQTSGTIYVNGQIRNKEMFLRRSCYILQDDMVQDLLTIQESLHIAAELKLGNHISAEQKKQRVEEIITSLGMVQARNTRAGKLSGGQKKRLAIGLELVNDPPVMFLDEPTSGLDSSISKQLVYLLHLLARQGRTVVVTMHQPSAALLDMVDRLYAIVAGKCAYMGSVPLLLPYLEQMNLTCPPYHNPVDFFIEICTENENQLVKYSKNGRDKQWINNITNETDSNLIEKYKLSKNEEVYLTTLPPPKADPTSKILLSLKGTYPTSSWKQFTTLSRRSFLSYWRDPSFTLIITGIHFFMALFVGFLFYNIGQEAQYVRDNFNFLYFSLMFLMFTAFSTVSIRFPEQLPVVRREHFNRWYAAGAYYSSTLVSSLPIQTICTLTFACVTYWLTGQPVEYTRFFGFCCTLLLVSYTSICIGLFNGSLFTVKNGVIFGPFFIMPFTVFSGFFLRYSDAPFFLQWLFNLSFLKHGLVGLVISIFGMNRPKLVCNKLYCHYSFPKKFLQDNDMSTEKYTSVVGSLFCIAFVFMLLSFIILKCRLKSKW